MQILNSAVMYFLSFKPYVLLPVIIFILALVFRIKLATAIKSAFSIGIGLNKAIGKTAVWAINSRNRLA